MIRFGELDRGQIEPIRAEVGRHPDGKQVAALIDRARGQLRQAQEGAIAARRAGEAWLAHHGSDQGGSSSGFEIAGGRAYLDASETSNRTAASALPAFPGEYTFVVHGSSEHVFVGGESLSAADVADLVKADPNWDGRPIRLFSCETGQGQEPIARELAKILGVKVTAPDEIVWIWPDGSYGIHPVETKLIGGEVLELPNMNQEGRWREFNP